MNNAVTGLTPAEISQFRGILRRHPEVQRAVLFGSRAKGCARPNSDIDLALYGDMSPLQVEGIAHELDELPTPYLFDVESVAHLQNPALVEHIERVGIEIYAAA
jgi:predicted nucleotidyltransferase